MANLIDGVIQAGSYVGVQCLQAVTDLTGIAVSAGGTAFSSAADLANWAKNTGNLSATPQLGDVAVWGAGQGGAAGAGHAGIVTGLGGGGVQVTSTNWPAGSGETQYTVGNNNVGMGAPLGYINPNVLGGKNIITGQTGTTVTSGLQQTGFAVQSTGGKYQTLAQAGFTGFPGWISQGVVLRRIGFTLAGLFLVVYGLHLVVGTPTPGSVVSKVPGVKL